MKTKTLNIQWKRLVKGSKTCNRCGDTGEALEFVVKKLRECCSPPCVKVNLRRIRLGADRLSETNEVTLNGRAVEDLLPSARKGQSNCSSCAELIGGKASCRTVETKSGLYETLPVKMLWRAATAAVGCRCALREDRGEKCRGSKGT